MATLIAHHILILQKRSQDSFPQMGSNLNILFSVIENLMTNTRLTHKATTEWMKLQSFQILWVVMGIQLLAHSSLWSTNTQQSNVI